MSGPPKVIVAKLQLFEGLFLSNLGLYLKLLDKQKIRYKKFLEYVNREILEKEYLELEKNITPISI